MKERGPSLVISDDETRAKVEFLLWPLQEEPSVVVLLQDVELTLGEDKGLLKTVNFTTDHIDGDLRPEDFHISEREGFANTTLQQLQEYLANEWNE